MLYKSGVFWPAHFPWPYDSARSVVLKLAIINRLPVVQLLGALGTYYPHQTSQLDDIRFLPIIRQLYPHAEAGRAQQHLISLQGGYFPKTVSYDYKYCPRCAEEWGHVSVYFSLSFVQYCPWHEQPLHSLCEQCLTLSHFSPTALGTRWGYDCQGCGFKLPTLEELVRHSLNTDFTQLLDKSQAFFSYTQRLQRCGALESLFLQYSLEHHDHPKHEVAIQVSPFVPQSDIAVWQKQVCVQGSDYRKLGRAAEANIQCVYEQFCRFWQSTMLRHHTTCLAHVIQAHQFSIQRQTCAFALAVFMFRLKFEAYVHHHAPGALSPEAMSRIVSLGLDPGQLRQYFSCYLHNILAMLLFWIAHGVHPGIRVETKAGFWDIFATGNGYPAPLRLSGRDIMGRCYKCLFDLPAQRQTLKQILHHDHPCSVIETTVLGDIICIAAKRRGYLYGRFVPPTLIHV